MADKSFVDAEKVEELNDKIYDRGMVDREHLLEFLECINTSDQKTIVEAVKDWLKSLHDDPKYDKIVFPGSDIEAILGDLDSYGRVQPETIMKFKEESSRSMS